MNIKQLLKKIISQACICFTIITALYALIVMFVNVEDDTILLDASRILLFFLFSVLLSVANGIHALERLHSVLRVLLHYVITLFAFFACFMLPISPTPSQNLVGFVLFTLLYLIIAALLHLIRSRYRALSQKENTYDKQFSPKK